MFERFIDRARRVVVLAQEEARLLNHNYIGTEHLLLGMVHEHNGVAAKALASVGVTGRATRDAVANIIGVGGSAPSGHVPFTPRAKKVLELSLREAIALGHNYIGTEHLLLGLVREGDGVGVQVLLGAGVDFEQLRLRVIELAGLETEPTPFVPGPPLRMGELHMVLAALESEDSLVGKVLRSFGLTKAEFENRMVEMRGEGEQATPE